MEKADESLKIAGETLEKYRKNKTMVPPEDLKGKYKIPFERLREKLKTELENYLKAYCLEALPVFTEDAEAFAEECSRAWLDSGYPKKAGTAAFKNFSLAEFQEIAEEYRKKVQELWEGYFHKHTCLYACGQCFAEENPHDPLIYNNLVDKFWDEGTGEWIVRENPPGDAILIFAGGSKDE